MKNKINRLLYLAGIAYVVAYQYGYIKGSIATVEQQEMAQKRAQRILRDEHRKIRDSFREAVRSGDGGIRP